MSGDAHEVVVLLHEFEQWLSDQQFANARTVLDTLHGIADQWPDGVQRTQLWAIVNAQRQRLLKRERRRRRALAKVTATSAQRGKAKMKKQSQRCEVCGQTYTWRSSDPTRFCDICRPRRNRSIRTVSGGLPTLGR